MHKLEIITDIEECCKIIKESIIKAAEDALRKIKGDRNKREYKTPWYDKSYLQQKNNYIPPRSTAYPI